MIIGIDIGGSTLRLAKIIDSHVKDIVQEPFHTKKSKEETLHQLFAFIDAHTTPQLQAIGVGVVDVDVHTGIIHHATNIPSWDYVNLKEVLQQRYGVRVYINNDANCFVLAHKKFGLAQQKQHVVGLITGTGTGAGILLNNSLYVGAQGFSGEFGKIPYLDADIETYTSSKFFQKKDQQGELLYAQAQQGDKNALNTWAEYATHLANAVAIIVHTLNPQQIILGGSVSKGFCFYEEALRSTLTQLLPKEIYDSLDLVPSTLKNAGVLGAAALCVEHIHTENNEK